MLRLPLRLLRPRAAPLPRTRLLSHATSSSRALVSPKWALRPTLTPVGPTTTTTTTSPTLASLRMMHSQGADKPHHSQSHGGKHGSEKEPKDAKDAKDAKMGPVWPDLVKLMKLARRDVKLLACALTLLLVSCLVNMTMPRAYGLVLDATKHAFDGHLPDNIVFGLSMHEFIGALACVLLLGIASDYGRIILMRVLGERLVARLRASVIKKTMAQDAEFFDAHKVGDLISRLGSDAYVVSRSMTQNISDGCKHAITGSVSIASMFLLSTQLASAVFIFLPAVLVGTLIFGAKVRVISRGIQEATGNLTKVGEEQLSGIKTVQSFVAEQKEQRKYNDAIKRVFKLGVSEAKLNAMFYSSTYTISDATFLVILAYGAQLVVSGTLSLGDLAAFMLYVQHSGSSMFGLASFYSELMKGTGAASRLFELADREPSINATRGLPVPAKPTGQIEFRNVGFSYPTRPKIAIFTKLSFIVQSGSNVCIVGPSGRGKSTITSLLLRYYSPQGGEILLDGQDITKYNAKSLRRHLGVVQQEPILMSGTIRDNITFGLKHSVPEEQVIEAAIKANCHDFISKFPDGYDTVIGPRGALLSGGQKQRVSIARALIKNPSVLILDEATSALDTKSEHAINLTLQKLMRDEHMTTISIAHRLSTIRQADVVIVLGYDGTVAESGKFTELYANTNSALYRLLHEEKMEHHHTPKEQKDSHHEEQPSDEFLKREIIKGIEDTAFQEVKEEMRK